MCSLDLETILKYQQEQRKRKVNNNLAYTITLEDKIIHEDSDDFTKAMQGAGGYFRELGGCIIDTRNKKLEPD
jgi:hypothetical protein